MIGANPNRVVLVLGLKASSLLVVLIEQNAGSSSQNHRRNDPPNVWIWVLMPNLGSITLLWPGAPISPKVAVDFIGFAFLAMHDLLDTIKILPPSLFIKVPPPNNKRYNPPKDI